MSCETKICSKCKVEKPLDGFHRASYRKSGRTSKCKLCRKILESEKNRLRGIEWRKKNPNKNKEWKDKNKDRVKEYGKKWRSNNKERIKKYGLFFRKKRRKEKPHIFIWRGLIWSTMRKLGTKKEDYTINLLKYSALELKEHLEKQFIDGMSWENYGEWHVDHIYPISKFPKDTPPHIVNALENLQPLWAEDNLKKGNNLL